MKSRRIALGILCLTLTIAQPGTADDLRARLTELEKLRADKLITDAEYQDMRKAALQNFTQASSPTSSAASTATTTQSVAPALQDAPDLSTPLKAVEALQRAWNAKDQAGVVRVTTGKLKEQISSSTPEVAEKNFSDQIRSIGAVEGPITKDGKELCKITVKLAHGKEESSERIGLVKEGNEWHVTDI